MAGGGGAACWASTPRMRCMGLACAVPTKALGGAVTALNAARLPGDNMSRPSHRQIKIV